MRRSPVFQTDDLYDEPEVFCSCSGKAPRLDGGKRHWECKNCGRNLAKIDRTGKKYNWYRNREQSKEFHS